MNPETLTKEIIEDLMDSGAWDEERALLEVVREQRGRKEWAYFRAVNPL
jgi:hypothetical protein